MAKFCTQCGTQLPDNANVCSNCGVPLSAPVQYQPAKPSKSFGETLNDAADKIAGLLNILAIVFVALAATAFTYHLIVSIVNAADYESFLVFTNGFASAIGTLAKYVFFAAVTAALSKLLKK